MSRIKKMTKTEKQQKKQELKRKHRLREIWGKVIYSSVMCVIMLSYFWFSSLKLNKSDSEFKHFSSYSEMDIKEIEVQKRGEPGKVVLTDFELGKELFDFSSYLFGKSRYLFADKEPDVLYTVTFNFKDGKSYWVNLHYYKNLSFVDMEFNYKKHNRGFSIFGSKTSWMNPIISGREDRKKLMERLGTAFKSSRGSVHKTP